MRLIRLVKYSVFSRGSTQCNSAPENCQQINMAFLSNSLKASGLYIKFACAIQRVAKSGTLSSIAFLSFSPRSPRVHVTQGFITQGWRLGRRVQSLLSRSTYICWKSPLPKPGRALATSVARIALPRSHPETSPDDRHRAGDQLPEGTSGTAAQQPPLGLLPSVLPSPPPCCSQGNGQKQSRGGTTFHKRRAEETPHQLSGEERF